MCGLKHRDDPPHIPLTQTQYLINDLLLTILILAIIKVTFLLVGNVQNAFLHAHHGQRCKAEFGTATRQWFDDARDIIANEYEACDLAIGLNDTSECRLGITGDGIGLVEDYDFEEGGWDISWLMGC